MPPRVVLPLRLDLRRALEVLFPEAPDGDQEKLQILHPPSGPGDFAGIIIVENVLCSGKLPGADRGLLGPVLSMADDIRGEARERSCGLVKEAVVVCVVHTERGAARRTVNARKATRKEREEFRACLTRAIG